MKFGTFEDFVEFKNTKQGKKVDEQQEILKLRFSKISNKKTGAEYVTIVISSDLAKSLKKNQIFSFKLLYQESTNNILLKYDKSSNAFSIVDKRCRASGEYVFIDKYITAVLLDVMKDKGSTYLSYEGKYFEDKLSYLFKMKKSK